MSADDFCINKFVPGYFSRINEDGSYSNGSGCGNDTASERNMVRKYIVDSVCYWADVFEYYKGLIKFRKAHPALRLSTSEDVKKYVKSVEGLGVQFTMPSGLHSVLERPFSEANGRPFLVKRSPLIVC